MERFDPRDDPGSLVSATQDDSEALLHKTARAVKGFLGGPESDAQYRQRMHRALDELLDRVYERRRRSCSGDREFRRRRI